MKHYSEQDIYSHIVSPSKLLINYKGRRCLFVERSKLASLITGRTAILCLLMWHSRNNIISLVEFSPKIYNLNLIIRKQSAKLRSQLILQGNWLGLLAKVMSWKTEKGREHCCKLKENKETWLPHEIHDSWVLDFLKSY